MASPSPPPPPANLDRIDLPVVTVDPAALLRLFPFGKPPIHFRVAKKGQKAYRFDAPNGEFGVMYCAFTLEGASPRRCFVRVPTGRPRTSQH